MARIHVLDETTINKIAAGEVVERPASVIKELVENAIDAGSKSIEVEIEEGGIEYMRITDDGIGMTEEDARLAVLRHATSKIQAVEDLFDIASLGFRGEALASIASVSHFSLTTRTHDQELGTRVTIDGGHFSDCLPYGAAPGTTIEVKELFYNTPARRKFLKTPRTEASKIQDIVGKLALANTHISFKLIVDGKMAIITPGNGDIFDTVTALYGYKTREDIFPVAYEDEGIFVDGVVAKPTLIKSSRIWQTVIVNNRVISDRAITKAIDNAYHALLPKHGHPLVLLNIVVPPDMVDINVHPRKAEVKFADDKRIFKAVYHAILGALNNPLRDRLIPQESQGSWTNGHGLASGQGLSAENQWGSTGLNDFGSSAENELNTSTESDLSTALMGDSTFVSGQNANDSFGSAGHSPLGDGQGTNHSGAPIVATTVDYDKVFSGRGKGYEVLRESTNDFVASLKRDGYQAPEKVSYEQDSFMGHDSFSAVPMETKSYTQEDREKFRALQGQSFGQAVEATSRVVNNTGLLPMGQVASCYILAKQGDDLYIIDQHAAHERVRYDKLCKSAESIPMQASLVPRYMNATEEEMTLVEEEREALLDLGYDIELGGPSQIKIVGSPVDIVEEKNEEIVQFIFSYLQDHQQPTKAQLRHEMLAYASCRGAIKAGHNLNLQQMAILIEDLFATDKPYVCPHGRPTIIKFTPDELGKLFLRS